MGKRRRRSRLRIVNGSPPPDANDVIDDARIVAEDAAAVAQSAAALLNEAAAGNVDDDSTSAAIHDAAAAVQEAAVVVQEAANLVADAARTWPDVDRRVRPRVGSDDPRAWPDVERRTRPRVPAEDTRTWPQVDRRRGLRLPAFTRHEAHVGWKHLAFYAPILLLVFAVGAFALWSFFEKQSLVIQPSPLPKVTLLTGDPSEPATASWVKLLSAAEMQPTLVPLEKAESLRGVVVLCNLWHIPPGLASALAAHVNRGGGVVILGAPPAEPIGPLHLTATGGDSDDTIKLSEAVSPVLARLNPGYEVPVRRSHVAFLSETPRMTVDARWGGNARAVVMHMEERGARVLWFGFDPAALPPEPDRQLTLMLRTSFRWVAGQPVSEGAAGSPAEAKTFTPEARREARAARFAWSVDPVSKNAFRVLLTNRGAKPIDNPTVKVWLPPGTDEVSLGGDWLMRRNVTLACDPEEGACLVSLPTLERNAERQMKLKVSRR
jgi:hypothetical protein